MQALVPITDLNKIASAVHSSAFAKGIMYEEHEVIPMLVEVLQHLGYTMDTFSKGQLATWRQFVPLETTSDVHIHDLQKLHYQSHTKGTFQDMLTITIMHLLSIAAGTGIDLDFQTNAVIAYKSNSK
jgi:hypothetical protein